MDNIVLKIRHANGARSRGKVRVVIFHHLKDLRACAKEQSGHGGWGTAAGAYAGLEKGEYFGAILLWKDIIGAGYFAHELQHFITDYLVRKDLFKPILEQDKRFSETSEMLSWICGDMTAQFWAEYYKLYPDEDR